VSCVRASRHQQVHRGCQEGADLRATYELVPGEGPRVLPVLLVLLQLKRTTLLVAQCDLAKRTLLVVPIARSLSGASSLRQSPRHARGTPDLICTEYRRLFTSARHARGPEELDVDSGDANRLGVIWPARLAHGPSRLNMPLLVTRERGGTRSFHFWANGPSST
jgi:hypothetical protein